jgi:hypothetical protein
MVVLKERLSSREQRAETAGTRSEKKYIKKGILWKKARGCWVCVRL